MTNFYSAIGWHPTIGDPSFMGWFTVLAYFFAFCISLKVYLTGDRRFHRNPQKQKLLWLVLAVLMLLLCINKQLDLQTMFTATAKYYFLKNDMYQYRRHYQKLFIILIMVTGFLVSGGERL